MCFEGAGTNPGEKTLEDKFFEYEASCLTLVPFLIALFLRYRLFYHHGPNLVLHLEPRLLNRCPFRWTWTWTRSCSSFTSASSTPSWNWRNKSAETSCGSRSASPRSTGPKSTTTSPSSEMSHFLSVTQGLPNFRNRTLGMMKFFSCVGQLQGYILANSSS